jgi:ketosteroid isomerase-like protein
MKTPDTQIREQIIAIGKQFDERFNNHNAVGLGALFTEDAILVTDQGPIYGRDAIIKSWADQFQQVDLSNHLVTVDEYSPHGTAGNEVSATGAWSMTVKGEDFGSIEQKGYWCTIDVREGDSLKMRLLIWNVTPPASAPTQ